MRRKNYSSDFKARVALEAIRGVKTTAETGSTYDVHQNVVGMWKKQALEYLPDAFSNKRAKQTEDETALRDRLYQQIGQLHVEMDWLKKVPR